MLTRWPRFLRVFIGLLLVLTHVALQPGKALSFVLCTEQDGRSIVEFAASGSCRPASAHEVGGAELATPCCEECADRLLPADPAPTLSSKRGEAPQTILPTGPPSEGDALTSISACSIVEAAQFRGRRFVVSATLPDPLLLSLRSVRLLT